MGISVELPRVPIGSFISSEEMIQAFFAAYQGYYSSQAIQPRVDVAYKRAWGMHEILMFPSKPNGTPGFCVFLWGGDEELWRMSIGIEGARTTSQIVPWMNNYGLGTVTGCTGRVVNLFNTYASDIYDQLFANVQTAAHLQADRTLLTFSGHSLGAACAEILAYRIQALRPRKSLRLIKFGAPRVGTLQWVGNQSPQVEKMSVYCERDPIGIFPVWAPGFQVGVPMGITGVSLTPLARDQITGRWSRSGEMLFGSYIPDFIDSTSRAIGQSSQTVGPLNPWYDHHFDSYRLMLNGYAARQGDALQYRTLYLEHNNENDWQRNWIRGSTEFGALGNILNPAPVDMPPTNTGVSDVITTLRSRLQFVVPVAEEAPQAVPVPAGREWVPPPAPPGQNLPRRTFRRQTPL